MHAHRLILGLCLVVVLAGANCRRPLSTNAVRTNVLLVVIDTLRKDHVTTYGYERDTTPNIDALGKRGLVCTDAVAQSSWTLPSMVSLLTSKYAPHVEQSANGLRSLAPEATTIAELVEQSGYRTISIATNPYNADASNLMQGFQERDLKLSAPADWVVDQAIERIDRALAERDTAEAPLFVYLHFMDVHVPRKPPPPYDGYFPARDGKPNAERHQTYARFETGKDLDSDAFATYRSHVISLYDGALRFVDAQLGRLMEHFDATGTRENWLVVVTADHGEELWDHAARERELGLAVRPNLYGVGHGQSLFPELIEVPLVFSGPGVPTRRFAGLVRLIDVVPTILSFIGLDASGFDPEGADVAPRLAATTPDAVAALSETWTLGLAQKSYRDDRYQLLRLGERELLYDRRSDSFAPLAEHAAEAARLRAGLDRTLLDIRRAPTAPLELDPDLAKRLRALGYAR